MRLATRARAARVARERRAPSAARRGGGGQARAATRGAPTARRLAARSSRPGRLNAFDRGVLRGRAARPLIGRVGKSQPSPPTREPRHHRRAGVLDVSTSPVASMPLPQRKPSTPRTRRARRLLDELLATRATRRAAAAAAGAARARARVRRRRPPPRRQARAKNAAPRAPAEDRASAIGDADARPAPRRGGVAASERRHRWRKRKPARRERVASSAAASAAAAAVAQRSSSACVHDFEQFDAIRFGAPFVLDRSSAAWRSRRRAPRPRKPRASIAKP